MWKKVSPNNFSDGKLHMEILVKPTGYFQSVHIYYEKSGRRKILKHFKTKNQAFRFAQNYMKLKKVI